MADCSAIESEPLPLLVETSSVLQAQRAPLKIPQETNPRPRSILAVPVHAAMHVPVQSDRADVLPQHAAHVLQNWALLAGVAVYTLSKTTAITVPHARAAEISSVSVARKLMRFN